MNKNNMDINLRITPSSGKMYQDLCFENNGLLLWKSRQRFSSNYENWSTKQKPELTRDKSRAETELFKQEGLYSDAHVPIMSNCLWLKSRSLLRLGRDYKSCNLMVSLMDVDSACEGKGDKQEERKMGIRYKALNKC